MAAIETFKAFFRKFIGQANQDDYVERRKELEVLAAAIKGWGGDADDIRTAISEGDKALTTVGASEAYKILAAVNVTGRETPEEVGESGNLEVANLKLKAVAAKQT